MVRVNPEWPLSDLHFSIQKENLSEVEYEERRAQLLNKQQLELANLERQHSDEQKEIERGTLTDWEVRYARAKLDLKEKHYKVSDHTGPAYDMLQIYYYKLLFNVY